MPLWRRYNTGDGQNNGTTRHYKNKIVYIGCPVRILVVSFVILLFVCIFRYSFICLCCVVPVSMHYRLCLVTVRVNALQNGRLVRFWKRTDCWCEFSWSGCNYNGVSSAAAAVVITPYTDHGKTSSAEGNSGRKPKLSERDRCTLKRIVSENHRTVAAKVTTAELIQCSSWRPFPHKQSNEITEE